MKKKILFFIIVIMVISLLAVVIFFLVTRGTIEEKDGLLQNSRVYMKDIRCKDGKIYYTIVNQTYRYHFVSDKPYVQKKVDGEWEFVSVWEERSSLAARLDPFEERERYFAMTLTEELAPGEYRLLFGEFIHTSDGSKKAYLDLPYIVGYFTVTAPAE